MSARTASNSPAVLSYHAMSRALGLVALSLPFVLAIGSIVLSLGSQHALPRPLIAPSISDYYFSPMRNVYVGSLCAISVFFVCMRGYDLADEIAGYIAGVFSFGVAIFPPVDARKTGCTAFEAKIGFIHLGCAALMFVVLAYLCLLRFRKSDRELTPRKRHRNRLYAACGITIVACMVEMVWLTLSRFLNGRQRSHWMFWLEALALVAFGIAWLTKGGGILKDTVEIGIEQNADTEELVGA
jgi:hypothetical protein